MSATEAERHELYELAKRHVNDRYAELMLKSLPPEPDRLATKDDVAFAQAATRADLADVRTELKTDMVELRTELKTDMVELRTELKTDMAELRTELKTDMADLRTDMAEFRAEMKTDMAGLRAELVDRIESATTRSTRTIVLSLVGSVTAMSIANTLTIALTR